MSFTEYVKLAVRLGAQVESLGETYFVVIFADAASKSVFMGVVGRQSEFVINAHGLSVTVALSFEGDET